MATFSIRSTADGHQIDTADNLTQLDNRTWWRAPDSYTVVRVS